MVSIWLTPVNGWGEKVKMPKTGFFYEAGFQKIAMKWTARAQKGLLAVLLDAGGAQSGQTVLVDGELPRQEFVDSQGITAAGFLEGQEAAANGCHNLGLTADNPPFGTGRREIRDRQRTAIWPDDVLYPRAVGFCHGVLTNSKQLNSWEQGTPVGLKFA
jgi:hypothetical protein